MCYLCSCFAWLLDFIQRLITFGLACILCGAVIFGLTIATVAGIAYGYNYSIAEFITFTRSDVTVFMRRGQFYDKSYPNLRRSGTQDLFSTNTSTDYEDQKTPVKGKQLADTWLKSQDTRKYAQVLTRYNSEKVEAPPEEPSAVRQLPTEMPTREVYLKPSPLPAVPISIVPNPLIPTVTWRSGSSQIMMRNFQPLQEYTTVNNHLRPISILSPKETAKEYGNLKFRDDNRSKYIESREWGTTARAVISDEPDYVDEDNIVYKPV
ncbi:hypothetical protein PYW07_004407 [Mythimna separata]|uniref:Uncharacterized protein n=1 Tax=Mythimna separata TaxID=271217 RepID=A0AAD7YZ26_MYTSE|nr:hypothetical protein PYW07_004407 [Mythimna separata]